MPAPAALKKIIILLLILIGLPLISYAQAGDKFKECPQCHEINNKPAAEKDARFCFQCGTDLTGLKYHLKDEATMIEEGVKDKIEELGEAGKMSAAEWYQRGHTSEDMLLKIACFRISLQREDNPRVHSNLGVLYGRRALSELALKEFEAAVKLDDNYATAHANLGRVLTDLKEYKKAEIHLRKAMLLEKNNPGILVNWGNLLAATSKKNDAEQVFRQVLKIDPKGVSGRIAAFQLQRLSLGKGK